MPLVGFEPTIPAFERAKTFHASAHQATVIGGGTKYPGVDKIGQWEILYHFSETYIPDSRRGKIFESCAVVAEELGK
jgi:hypothetical protein